MAIGDGDWPEQCGGSDVDWLQQTGKLRKYLAAATAPGSVSWSSLNRQHVILPRVFAHWRLTAAALVSCYPAAVEKVATRSRNADS